MPEEDIWDENQWESFLRKDDERVNRYMNHLIAFLTANPFPDTRDRVAMAGWEARLRAYLVECGWYPDDIELAFIDSDDFASDEGAQIVDPSEDIAWDTFLVDDGDSAREELQLVAAYQLSFQLATIVLEWTDNIPGAQKDSLLVQFCTNALQISSNIAKGHSLGFEREMLGGYIACVKRALNGANAALEALPDLKEKSYMDASIYRQMYELLFEVRNEVGIYVQELRRRFDLGIE